LLITQEYILNVIAKFYYYVWQILTAIVLTGCLSYVKVINASILSEHGGAKALLWCGIVTQIGSFVGAIVTFIVINVLHLLQSEPGC